MRRATFLDSVGISSHTYKNMCRYGHAPIMIEEPGETVGWTEYSTADVVMTALAVALGDGGLNRQIAAAIVVMGKSLVKEVWPRIQHNSESQIHFGAALMHTSNAAMWLPTVGPLSDLMVRNRSRETFRLAECDHQCEKLILSNLNILKREIEQRARAAGFGGDFTHLGSIS